MVFRILIALVQVIVVIGVIVWIVRKIRGRSHKKRSSTWYLEIALSKEEGLSNLFLLLAFLFFGMLLQTLNQNFGSPVSIQSVVMVTAVIGIIGTYLLRAIYLLPVSLIGVVSWWVIEMADLLSDKKIGYVGILTGLGLITLLFYIIGQNHEIRSQFKRVAVVYSVFGLVGTAGLMFILSTQAGLVFLQSGLKDASVFGVWQIAVSLLVLIVAVLAASGYALSKRLTSIYEVLAIAVLAVLFIALPFIPEGGLLSSGRSYGDIIDTVLGFSGASALSSTGVIWAAMFNGLTFALLVGIIFAGYRQKEVWMINLGAIFLFLFVIMKYFDWFFTFLDKSVFFITAGMLLLLLGWGMEKGRRYLISATESS